MTNPRAVTFCNVYQPLPRHHLPTLISPFHLFTTHSSVRFDIHVLNTPPSLSSIHQSIPTSLPVLFIPSYSLISLPSTSIMSCEWASPSALWHGRKGEAKSINLFLQSSAITASHEKRLFVIHVSRTICMESPMCACASVCVCVWCKWRMRRGQGEAMQFETRSQSKRCNKVPKMLETLSYLGEMKGKRKKGKRLGFRTWTTWERVGGYSILFSQWCSVF